eukprot:CAMPEP_0115310236 /NCGR_PEP_ID=MMETSP0270-20121206/74692_1 /TAXON_ID=71861 /ORGANISM="Scrippsiella trochoidea, Strain CCMP3099" /LENGTH=46 /DNA_ID= /DNA_START= /DNA_END= /DNA_ORIENTATION=
MPGSTAGESATGARIDGSRAPPEPRFPGLLREWSGRAGGVTCHLAR